MTKTELKKIKELEAAGYSREDARYLAHSGDTNGWVKVGAALYADGSTPPEVELPEVECGGETPQEGVLAPSVDASEPSDPFDPTEAVPETSVADTDADDE